METSHMFHCLYLLLLLFTISLQLKLSHTQQPYLNNKQLDCYNTSFNFTKGYTCNGLSPSCQAYLTFRSTATYNSLATIAYLLDPQASLMTMISINNLTDVQTVPINTRIIIPVNCSCSGRYYQHNSTYILKSRAETYQLVANDTYQGLSTCQAMMEQNPYDSYNLSVGENISVPLRCACPTQNQAAEGVKYLLTYLVTWGETISEIAALFGASEQSVLDANELSEDSTIFPFNPILVPLAKVPTKIEESVSPPPANPPEPPADTTPDSNSSKKWIFIGVAIGVAVLVIVLGLLCWFLFYKKDKPQKKPIPVDPIVPKKALESSDNTSQPTKNSWSVLSTGIRDAVENLTVYEFEDLQEATESFSEGNRIRGSVYRGKFNGDDAAIKLLKFNTSSEINMLRQINHSNITRLSGFCVHGGNTYLVYEYAENGSLSDWLHLKKDQASPLSWKMRVQIAYNVADALNYVHNYMNPPYIHKNFKTSNVLLDHEFRAKIANFGLARMVDDNAEGGLQLTRHVVGTQGYMAPEYIENGVITPKMDVFAFGVVMLELLSGREAAGDTKSGEELLSVTINQILDGDNVREKLERFMDSCLNNEYPLDLAFAMAELAKRCVATDMNSRPAMTEVFMTLSKIHSSSLEWDPSDELDRSRELSYGK